jgi:hypothetical protein
LPGLPLTDQVFVESLDRSFENVCELDLIFHFDEVHHVLSEIIQGGLVLETNINEISSCGTHQLHIHLAQFVLRSMMYRCIDTDAQYKRLPGIANRLNHQPTHSCRPCCPYLVPVEEVQVQEAGVEGASVEGEVRTDQGGGWRVSACNGRGDIWGGRDISRSGSDR